MTQPQQSNGAIGYVGRHGLAQLCFRSAFYHLLPAHSAQIAGRTAWKLCGARFSPQDSSVAMFACLCLPASLLLLSGATLLFVYATLIIQGACYGVHTILRPGIAQRYLPPSHLGRGLGTIAMVGLLMMATGPAIGGLIWTIAGETALMSTLLLLYASALLLGWILRRTLPREAMV